jgi:hypothetical protein
VPSQLRAHVSELPAAALLHVALPALATAGITTHQQATCTAAAAASQRKSSLLFSRKKQRAQAAEALQRKREACAEDAEQHTPHIKTNA